MIHAKTDAELQAATAMAKAGTCISLAPGTYGAAALPGGVSLLGRSPDDVHLALGHAHRQRVQKGTQPAPGAVR